MKVVAIGADISSNDVSVSQSLVENIEKDIPKLLDLGAKKAALTNITGDATIDILVIGALDPSEGVAIMLSPEAADAIGIDEIIGICLSENVASKHVLSKCGFETLFEGLGDYQGEEKNIYKSIWKK